MLASHPDGFTAFLQWRGTREGARHLSGRRIQRAVPTSSCARKRWEPWMRACRGAGCCGGSVRGDSATGGGGGRELAGRRRCGGVAAAIQWMTYGFIYLSAWEEPLGGGEEKNTHVSHRCVEPPVAPGWVQRLLYTQPLSVNQPTYTLRSTYVWSRGYTTLRQ